MEKPAEGPHLRRETAAGSGKEAPFPQGMNACKDTEGILAGTHTTSLQCMHPSIQKEQAPTAPTRNTGIVTETQQEEETPALEAESRQRFREPPRAWKISSFFFVSLSLRSALNCVILRDATQARGRGHHRSKREGRKVRRKTGTVGFDSDALSSAAFLYSGILGFSLILSRVLSVVVGAPAPVVHLIQPQ